MVQSFFLMEPEGSLLCSQVLTTIHILSQLNFIHILPNLFFCFNIIIPSVPMSSQSVLCHFTTSVLSLPIQAKCPAQLILPYLIIVY